MRVLAVPALLAALVAASLALPTSLVAEAQEAASKAVRGEEAVPDVRATTARPETADRSPGEALPAHMRRAPAPAPAPQQEDNPKTVKQYEKGYLYGVGKEALDKKAENALLKSEVYGDPVNEYRYYGGGDSHRQERVAPKKKKSAYGGGEQDTGTRLKRDLDLDPESLLALISLWQSEHKNGYPAYRDRPEYPRYGFERQEEPEDSSAEDEDVDNGEWLDNPVPLSRYQYEVGSQYPSVSSHYSDGYPAMRGVYYPPLTRVEHKRGQWGAFAPSLPEKRFMVSKRRQASQWEEPSVWSRLLASQPREPLIPGATPRRRILL